MHTHLPGFVICSEGRRKDREIKSYAGDKLATVPMVTNLSDSGPVRIGYLLKNTESRFGPSGKLGILVRNYWFALETCPSADRCAPVSRRSPDRNAQNINVTEREKGP